MTQRYQTLKPDDVLAILRAAFDYGVQDLPWCTIEETDDPRSFGRCKRFGTSCADTLCEEECLKAWLEEEVEA